MFEGNDEEELKQITAKMLAAAKDGDWDTLLVLQRDREPLLDIVFKDNSAVANETKRVIAEYIIDIDKDIIECWQGSRAQYMKDLKKITETNKAISTYKDADKN